MSPDNVKSLEKESFLRRIIPLSGQPEVADAEFAECIYIAVTTFGLSEDAFRAGFGLSKGAVDRWTTQKNMPQPSVRPHVLAWVAAQLSNTKP